MRRVVRVLSWVLILIAVAGAALVAFRPGPHRAIAPTSFGLHKIAPGIFTDAPGRADELVALVREAERRSAEFFGVTTARPRYVLCTTADCRRTFAIRGRGITLGYHAILAAPSGLREVTLTHERIHADLHSLMGPWDFLDPRYPSWFNEGLATHLSRARQIRKPQNARDADWVKAARTPLGWRRLRRQSTAEDMYGASARLVEEMEQRIGRDGLSALVARVAAGADFDDEYARVLAR